MTHAASSARTTLGDTNSNAVGPAALNAHATGAGSIGAGASAAGGGAAAASAAGAADRAAADILAPSLAAQKDALSNGGAGSGALPTSSIASAVAAVRRKAGATTASAVSNLRGKTAAVAAAVAAGASLLPSAALAGFGSGSGFVPPAASSASTAAHPAERLNLENSNLTAAAGAASSNAAALRQPSVSAAGQALGLRSRYVQPVSTSIRLAPTAAAPSTTLSSAPPAAASDPIHIPTVSNAGRADRLEVHADTKALVGELSRANSNTGRGGSAADADRALSEQPRLLAPPPAYDESLPAESSSCSSGTTLVPGSTHSRKRPLESDEPSTKRLREENRNPIPALDIEDIEDAGMCAEYAQEIMEYLMSRELIFMPNPDYITLHPDLKWKMRTYLVDWIIEVHYRFRFLPETLFLGVNIMDRVLSQRTCEPSRLQLLGLTALFIAAKTEEVCTPPVSQFAYMIEDKVPDSSVLEAEQYILRVLDYVFWAPGPFSFIRRISKVDDYNYHHRTLSKFFCEVSLLDERFLKFPPSCIAAASMWLARTLHGVRGWGRTFNFVSGYKEADLMPVVQLMLDFVSRDHGSENFFIQKYNSRRYLRAISGSQKLALDFKAATQLGISPHLFLQREQNESPPSDSKVPEVIKTTPASSESTSGLSASLSGNTAVESSRSSFGTVASGGSIRPSVDSGFLSLSSEQAVKSSSGGSNSNNSNYSASTLASNSNARVGGRSSEASVSSVAAAASGAGSMNFMSLPRTSSNKHATAESTGGAALRRGASTASTYALSAAASASAASSAAAANAGTLNSNLSGSHHFDSRNQGSNLSANAGVHPLGSNTHGNALQTGVTSTNSGSMSAVAASAVSSQISIQTAQSSNPADAVSSRTKSVDNIF